MIGAIDYFIVPTDCGYVEMPYYFKLDINKKKYRRRKCMPKNCPYDHPDYYNVVVLGQKRQRNLRRLADEETR